MSKRSKRYKSLKESVESGKVHSLEEAINLIKKSGDVKFDAGVELHVRTGIDVKSGDQQVRGTVTLPHGTGKQQIIVAITDKVEEAKTAGAANAGGEELIQEMQQTKKFDFDILVAEPKYMPKLAPLAKMLGPKGLMPSPKNGTVSPDVEKAVSELSKGKIAFKNDNTANVHMLVGRVSLAEDQLKENIQTAFDAITTSRPSVLKGTYVLNTVLSTSMGPGIKVKI